MYGSGLVLVLMVFSLALPDIGGFSPQILMSRFDFLSDQEMSVLLHTYDKRLAKMEQPFQQIKWLVYA